MVAKMQGRPSPKGNDAFPPISDVHLFSELSESGNIFPTFPKIVYVSSAKMYDDHFSLLVIKCQFRISPYSSYDATFPHYIGKLYILPQLFEISSFISENVRVFAHFTCFSFPPSLIMMHLCITQRTYVCTGRPCKDDRLN